MTDLKLNEKQKKTIPSVDIPNIDALYKTEKNESKQRFDSALLYVPEGRKKITQLTRYGTVLIASVQAIGVCVLLSVK